MPFLARADGVPFLLGGTLRTTQAAVAGPLTALSLIDFVTSMAAIEAVVQRTAGQIYADMKVLFAFTGGAPGSVQARVVQSGSGAIVVNWTALTNLTTTAATGSGVLRVPQGRTYLLQVRDGVTQPTSGALYSAGTTKWGVGVIVLAEGQSNMVHTFNFASYFDAVPGSALNETNFFTASRAVSVFDTNGWHGLNYPTGQGDVGGTSSLSVVDGGVAMMGRILAAGLATKYGYSVPVGIVPYAWNGTAIGAFLPEASHFIELFGGSSSTQGTIGFSSPRNVSCGDFEMAFWHQGEANQGDTSVSYKASLQTLYAGFLSHVAQFGRGPSNLLFGVAVIGSYTPGNCPSIENIRTAEQQFVTQANANSLSGQTVAWPAVKVGWTTIDLPPGADGLHMDAIGGKRSLRRLIQTALEWLGCATFGGRGPSLPGTYTRAGLVATLDVTIPSATTLMPLAAGSAVTGWYANTAADFSGTDIVVTAAVSSGTKVAVTFASGTSFPAYLKHCGGRIGSTTVDASGYTASCLPNITNLIYDSASYPTGTTGTDLDTRGLPLLPTITAITVS